MKGDVRRAAFGDKREAVQRRMNELPDGTTNAVGASAGAARIIERTYKVVCDSLNMRSAPSESIPSVGCD